MDKQTRNKLASFENRGSFLSPSRKKIEHLETRSSLQGTNTKLSNQSTEKNTSSNNSVWQGNFFDFKYLFN